MFDVLAHILIFGSEQTLHASYIYVLCLPAPFFFLLNFLLAYFSFLFLCAPLCAILFGGLLVSCYFLSSSSTIGFSLPVASKIGAIDLQRSELCIKRNTLRMCILHVYMLDIP
jgi:hypothetical protein